MVIIFRNISASDSISRILIKRSPITVVAFKVNNRHQVITRWYYKERLSELLMIFENLTLGLETNKYTVTKY